MQQFRFEINRKEQNSLEEVKDNMNYEQEFIKITEIPDMEQKESFIDGPVLQKRSLRKNRFLSNQDLPSNPTNIEIRIEEVQVE